MGGSLLMSPLLLYLNMSPNTTSATSSCISFFLSFAIIVQHLADMPYAFACWMFFLGSLGGHLGRRAAMYVVEVYNRQSVITFALVLTCCIAVLLLVIVTATEEGILSFKNACIVVNTTGG